MLSDSRSTLQTLLEEVLGSRNVYYQPPSSIKMSYPAIVYNLDTITATFANDSLYSTNNRYTLTLIDSNPNNEFVEKILKIKYCRFDRHFRFENLNHYVFSIFH